MGLRGFLENFGFAVFHSALLAKFSAHNPTRRRMARERRGAESSVVSMETLYCKTIY